MTTVVVLLLLLAGAWAGARQVANLRGLGDEGRTSGTGRIAVVIPARNEAGTLPVLLGSLKHGGSALAEVVVVDDGSTDGTGDVASAAGARVLAVREVPAGWTGKAWACQVGADATQAELLLFLDADTALGTGAVEQLLGAHRRYGGLVSVQPYHEVHAPYEQLSAYFNVMSLMGSGEFAHRRTRRPMAFGPCLLTSRADYQSSGGHEAIRGAILDDVELAAAYARAGLPVRCLTGGAALRMRMYPNGFRQLAEGWTKNIASGAGQAAPAARAGAAAWVICHFAVTVGVLLTILSGASGHRVFVTGPWFVWVIGWAGLGLQFGSILRRVGSYRWWTWAVFPVPLVAFGVLFARSVFLTYARGSVRWRGRDVVMHSESE
ncbi:glycosyltransferase family protein [Flexivirga lutea]